MNNLENFVKNKQHLPLDKWSHSLRAYDRLLAKFLDMNPTMYLIGSKGGALIQMWLDYFSNNVNLVVVESDRRIKLMEADNVKVRICAEGDWKGLSAVLSEGGQPNIVVDDGDHLYAHQTRSFELIFPLVALGGVYIVDGLDCSIRQAHPNFIDYTKVLVDVIHANHSKVNVKSYSRVDNRVFLRDVECFLFYDSLLAIEKREDAGQRKDYEDAIPEDTELIEFAEKLAQYKSAESVADLLTTYADEDTEVKKKKGIRNIFKIGKKNKIATE